MSPDRQELGSEKINHYAGFCPELAPCQVCRTDGLVHGGEAMLAVQKGHNMAKAMIHVADE